MSELDPRTIQPGTVGFAHSTGVMARLIRMGEFMRWQAGSAVNHEFLVSDEVDERGVPLAIQATMGGVTDNVPIDQVSPEPGWASFLNPPPEVSRSMAIEFAKAQVGDPYGLFTDIAIGVDIVTWDWFPSFRGARRNSWICSALVQESLRYAGWLHNWKNIYTVTPAQGYVALLPYQKGPARVL